MDKSGAGAGFLRELRFSLPITFHLLLRIIFTITRGWHKRPGVAAVPIASQTKYNNNNKKIHVSSYYFDTIQCVPGGKVNILGSPIISNSKQESVYVHVSYSELFPRYSYFTVQFQNC
jgi:hypothetical protein